MGDIEIFEIACGFRASCLSEFFAALAKPLQRGEVRCGGRDAT